MAFLGTDGRKRSADVIADEKSEVWSLSRGNFNDLPSGVRSRLMENISIELALRLRGTTQQLRSLEQ